jgi:hypothetical protein
MDTLLLADLVSSSAAAVNGRAKRAAAANQPVAPLLI